MPPIFDERVKLVPIGCGKCLECMKQKARGWQVRLLEELKKGNKAYFVSPTFSPDWLAHCTKKVLEKANYTGYELDNAVATYAVRKFLERWRKEYGKSLRHWLITELGQEETEHLHLHGIVWTDEPLNKVEKHWKYGTIHKGNKNFVNEKTVNYIIKYVTKADSKHKLYKPIILCSKGIGNNYTEQTRHDWKKNKYNGKETKETYITRSGHKVAMPIYWRNKIYTEENIS